MYVIVICMYAIRIRTKLRSVVPVLLTAEYVSVAPRLLILGNFSLLNCLIRDPTLVDM